MGTTPPQAAPLPCHSNYRAEPISERGVRKMVAKYLNPVGITKKVTPESFRHTFATQ